MAPGAIVFACANPVPEIWPYAAKEEGAFIVATGRGDFPNQVNNSVCFPGLLKGALLVRARKITDGMAIRCAHSIADFAERRGHLAGRHHRRHGGDRGLRDRGRRRGRKQAAARRASRGLCCRAQEVYDRAMADILASRKLVEDLQRLGHIAQPPAEMLDEALAWAIDQVRS